MTKKEISAFCMQVSLLLHAAISLDDGIYTMAEDAPTKEEKDLLTGIAKDLEDGETFGTALEKTKAFPEYVVQFAQVGQETGTLDVVMKSLAEYYAKEHQLTKTIKNALTYPVMMIFILLLIFFVLLTKVMPIFEDIYEQIGAQLSDVAKSAIDVGGIITGILIVVLLVLALLALLAVAFAKKGKKFSWAEKIENMMKEKSKVAFIVSKRRFAAALALTVKSGLDMEKGMGLAINLMKQKTAIEMARKCKDEFSEGKDFYQAIRTSGLFTGMDLQMLKVGAKAGRIDTMMDNLAENYEQEVDDAIDNIIGKFEPTMVAVLAVVVGLVLFSVMMPLIGIMSAIG